MLRLTTHIERLLLTHDCVIIPQVGGFVLQAVAAVYQKENHTFQPMRKEVVFNPALQHTDGLLAESYMQTYRVDYRKAQAMMDEDISELKASLQQYGKVSVGNIGSLTRGNEGQVIFQAGKTEMFGIDYYGLSSFHLPVLPPVVTEETTFTEVNRRKEIFYIPVNMRLVRGVVASAAAIALFFLVSTPVKDVQQSAYTASIIPSEILTSKTSVVAETVLSPEVAKPEEKAVEAPKPVIHKKMYHIVVGSFPNQEKADEYMAKMDQSLYRETGMIVRDGRYRVYARKFDNRAEAENYLSVIRESDKFRDAWLFISR